MSAGLAFDLLIFDFDGTLSDTRLAIAHCLQCALAKQGRPVPSAQRVFSIAGKGLSLRETFLSLDPALIEHGNTVDETIGTYRALYRSESEPLIRPIAGARETLQELHGLGATCIVVSNKGAEAVHDSLARHQLGPFIKLVLGDEPGTPAKPDPTLLTDRILPRFADIAKPRMLMIGDTEIDIEFARAGGIACCWAAYGFGDRERCLALAPQYRIDALDQLPAIVMGRSPAAIGRSG